MHIYFSRSTNGGTSWSTPVQVDQGNGNDAWEPAVAVDQSNGLVTIAWYDVRDDSGGKLYRAFYTESWDGGSTFQSQQVGASLALSDATTNCDGTGDYMQMVSVDGIAHPAWSNATNTMTAAIHEGHFPNCWTTPNASGWSSTLAINSNATVSAWGFNGFGELGDGTTTSRGAPVTVVGPGGIGTTLQGIESVAKSGGSGGEHSLALRQSDGSVWSWGKNTYGQLGLGGLADTNPHPVPQQVLGAGGKGYLTGVVAIAAGVDSSYALKTDGTVWAWGGNITGELGNADSHISYSSTPVEVKVGKQTALSGIVAVAASGVDFGTDSGSHVQALTSGGNIYSWGRNARGELGNNSTADSYLAVEVEGVNGNGFLSSINGIGALRDSSLAQSTTGQVYAWGDDGDGELGNGVTTGMAYKTPILSNFSTATSVAGGDLDSMALSSDRHVWTWGSNMFGQLGNGSTTDSNVPVQVSNMSSVTAISMGSFDGLAVRSDGTVWDWGLNGNGELGNGGTTNSSVPVQVTGLSLMMQAGPC
jgi:alpha-tubulin suppressor-like RCC1 family protein